MSSAKSWFVQTSFGATLGPMPDDALLEMIRTGALLRTDQVREGSNDEWRPAAEFPNLFDAVASTSAIHEPIASVAVQETSTTRPSDSFSVPSKIKLVPPTVPTRHESVSISEGPPVTGVSAQAATVSDSVLPPRAIQRNVTPSPERSVSSAAPPEDNLIASWRSERRRTQEDLGTDSLAAEMSQAQDKEDLVPELPAEQFVDAPEPASIAAPEKRTAARPSSQRPAFLDQINGLEDGRRQRVETSQQKWERWKRSLPSWQIAAVVMLVLLALWNYWPRSTRGIYDRYVAIWEEWKSRRADFKDQEGWDRFLKHTEAELNDTVPWLEKNARASERDKLMLLWIGRDCFRKMLKHPRVLGTPEEKQLQFLLTSVREWYDSPGSSTSPPGSAASLSADPEQSAGVGMFDPKLVRPEKQTTAPAAPKMPTKPAVSPAASPEDR